MRPAHDSTRPANAAPGPSNWTALVVWVAILVLVIPLCAYLVRHPDLFLAVEKEQPSRCLNRARELTQAGRYDDALGVLNRGLKFYREQLDKTGSPNHRMTVATIYHSMGLILLNRGQPGDREAAEGQFRQGVEMDPAVGRGEGQFLLGDYERERDPESALNRFAGVVAAVSDRQAIRARGRSAEILAGLGRWEEALRAYEDFVRFRSNEPDQEVSSAVVAIAERVGSGTGTALGRAYLQLGQREKARTQFQPAADAGDPTAKWYLSEAFGPAGPPVRGIEFNPRLAFAASVGIQSVSFTWPAGCVMEFVASKETAGHTLVVTLRPDRLRPQRTQLRIVLNDQDVGLIDIVRGDPTDYETAGVVRSGRNLLEIRCPTIWFEPDDRPVIELQGLKPGNRAEAE